MPLKFSPRLSSSYFAWVAIASALFLAPFFDARAVSCYQQMHDVLYKIMNGDENVHLTAWNSGGTDKELMKYAWEKEGLFYREISRYFDTIDREKFVTKLTARL